MKFSEQWLREWVNPPIDTHALAAQLTMAGLEIESITKVSGDFEKVVVGKIIKCDPHPNAEKLKICEVDIGEKTSLTIVCGGANARENLKVAVAVVGAELPNGIKIKATKLRDVLSSGMLCSAQELGLQESSEGILELTDDAPLGEDLFQWLKLNDHALDIHLTPNRGDCLSIAGIAREVGVLNNLPVTSPIVKTHENLSSEKFLVEVSQLQHCPRYCGRVITDINPLAKSPMWLKEKLRRSGIRSIHPVVDVTNFILLELGQPMHAFDLAKLKNKIEIRLAHDKEKIILLDGQEVTLDQKTLVIADSEKAHAIAGVMGGLASSVTENTHAIFLESAFFNPVLLAGCARRYGLNTDSAYRFERGIDPELAHMAIERATALLLDITGGKAGPIVEVQNTQYLPAPAKILLRKARIEKILGTAIPTEKIEIILHQLGMEIKPQGENFEITPPRYRYDISLEEDLIEELARINGYDNIPTHIPQTRLHFLPQSETKITLSRLRNILVDRGYHEAITYSFISPTLQKLISPQEPLIELKNPISSDLSVMRSSLFGGLLNAAIYNHNRKQTRVRLFETGLRFTQNNIQEPMLAGIATGTAYPEQWGIPNRALDFFDVKSDVEILLRLSPHKISFRPAEHPALHPGQTSGIYLDDELIGYLGALHPALFKEFDLISPVYLFELQFNKMNTREIPRFQIPSKFPAIRRDISFIVEAKFSVQTILETVREKVGTLLMDLCLFDVYQGKNMPHGKRSLALGLILQHPEQTLLDSQINEIMEEVISTLKNRFDINLRD